VALENLEKRPDVGANCLMEEVSIKNRLDVRSYAPALLPLHDLRLLDDGEKWESTGPDPQFDVVGPWPQGWIRISSEIETEGEVTGTARLYVDSGDGYSERKSYDLGAVNREQVNYIPLGPEVIRVRLDPFSAQGKFKVKKLIFQRVYGRVGQSVSGRRREALTRAISSGTKRLVVVLTPGYDMRLGGVLALASIYRESLALRNLHRARVALCVVPGEALLTKYTWFENRNYLLDLESVLDSCRRLDYLLLHIPEYAVSHVLNWLTPAAPKLLGKVREVQLNVVIQNIDLIQGRDITDLKHFGRVTCTTAHEAYTNSATREALGIPLHRLSVCTGPELYSRSGYQQKEALLIVSHDEHPLKEQVLGHISQAFPYLRIQVIQNLHYDDYRKLIRRAKWSLTFGEGLDGYFAEPVWSGGVAFAVFNERFFTPAFANLETVYPSWEVLMDRITTDLQRLDEPVAYTRCWRQAYDLLGGLYGTDRFRENLRKFHRGEYTFP
jgi:hypothetical protein